jgi:diacylglycerol kinase
MKKFLLGFRYAFEGLIYAIRTQVNLRVHIVLGSILIIVGIIFSISPIEWAILFVMMGVIFALEVVNTAIESAVDLVTKEQHPLAKVAKDAAAGAVLIAAIFAVCVALFIFVPRFLRFLFN